MRKTSKFISVLLAVLMICSILPFGALADEFAKGEDGKYHVADATDLAAFRDAVNAGNDFSGETVVLDSDIDLSGAKAWAGIGTGSEKFGGTFDGNGKTISNLTVNTDANYAGLFGSVFGATIKNVTLDNATVSNSVGDYTAALVGGGYAKIEGCTVKNSNVSGVDQIGGIIGYISCGSVKNCTVDSTEVTASGDRPGGIAGKANTDSEYVISGNTVNNCTIQGKVSAAIVGQIMTGTGQYEITNNNVKDTKVLDENGADAFNPIGNFREGYYNADTTKIANNYWTPADPASFKMVNPSDETQYFVVNTYVAKIGEVYYLTLAEAVAAAKDGDTVTMLGDVSGDGIVIDKNLTIDFGGFTYTVIGNTVGSTGTKTQAFQLLKGNDVTFKNGTITTTKDANAKMLVQNYSNLTLDNVVLDGSNLAGAKPYTSSNNNGKIVYKNGTKIIAAENGIAFDLYDWSAAYPDGINLTIDPSVVIEGDTEVSSDGKRENGDVKIAVATGKDQLPSIEALGDGYKWVENESGVYMLCNHSDKDVELKNAKDATCSAEGYTGDKICKGCSGIVEKGKAIPALGHDTEIKGAVAATETKDGYTGDKVCKTCGETVEMGKAIPAIGHTCPFTDIKDSGYHNWIEQAEKAGIINGYPDKTYRPNEKVTRAQFITMLYRAVKSPAASGTLSFTDNGDIADAYKNAVIWGVENGIILGYTDNSFRPNQEISRAQMATFMYRYMKNIAKYDFGTVTETSFADKADIANPYVEAVNAIVSADIMNGMSKTTFAPNDTANRGMAATVMLRMYNLLKG